MGNTGPGVDGVVDKKRHVKVLGYTDADLSSRFASSDGKSEQLMDEATIRKLMAAEKRQVLGDKGNDKKTSKTGKEKDQKDLKEQKRPQKELKEKERRRRRSSSSSSRSRRKRRRSSSSSRRSSSSRPRRKKDRKSKEQKESPEKKNKKEDRKGKDEKDKDEDRVCFVHPLNGSYAKILAVSRGQKKQSQRQGPAVPMVSVVPFSVLELRQKKRTKRRTTM